MKQQCCEGCGAALNLRRAECEWCRRPHFDEALRQRAIARAGRYGGGLIEREQLAAAYNNSFNRALSAAMGAQQPAPNFQPRQQGLLSLFGGL